MVPDTAAVRKSAERREAGDNMAMSVMFWSWLGPYSMDRSVIYENQ